jgi:hypothetical protein
LFALENSNYLSDKVLSLTDKEFQKESKSLKKFSKYDLGLIDAEKFFSTRLIREEKNCFQVFYFKCAEKNISYHSESPKISKKSSPEPKKSPQKIEKIEKPNNNSLIKTPIKKVAPNKQTALKSSPKKVSKKKPEEKKKKKRASSPKAKKTSKKSKNKK